MENVLICLFFLVTGAVVESLLLPTNVSDDKLAPSDYFKTDDVILAPNQIIINNSHKAQLSIGTVMASGSMVPVFDHNAVTINIVPQNPCEINVGDIIVFEESYRKNTLIIHRVVNITKDYEFITMGDHNLIEDDPVKFSQVRYKIVGILY